MLRLHAYIFGFFFASFFCFFISPIFFMFSSGCIFSRWCQPSGFRRFSAAFSRHFRFRLRQFHADYAAATSRYCHALLPVFATGWLPFAEGQFSLSLLRFQLRQADRLLEFFVLFLAITFHWYFVLSRHCFSPFSRRQLFTTMPPFRLLHTSAFRRQSAPLRLPYFRFSQVIFRLRRLSLPAFLRYHSSLPPSLLVISLLIAFIASFIDSDFRFADCRFSVSLFAEAASYAGFFWPLSLPFFIWSFFFFFARWRCRRRISLRSFHYAAGFFSYFRFLWFSPLICRHLLLMPVSPRRTLSGRLRFILQLSPVFFGFLHAAAFFSATFSLRFSLKPFSAFSLVFSLSPEPLFSKPFSGCFLHCFHFTPAIFGYCFSFRCSFSDVRYGFEIVSLTPPFHSFLDISAFFDAIIRLFLHLVSSSVSFTIVDRFSLIFFFAAAFCWFSLSELRLIGSFSEFL